MPSLNKTGDRKVSKMDIIGLAVAVIGIMIALAIACHIAREELDEPDLGDHQSNTDHDPDGDGKRGEDPRRNIALDMIDGRSTRMRGEPMPACAAFPRGATTSFRHGQREIMGTVTGGAGRRLRLLGELPGDREFLTRRKTYEVTRH